ncbi:MAG: formylglycine-generating enzyme family protein [Anaerolineae bacterium]|nr:formylglycine-generating enzyme family protein [Anaerolineae bacterium]
MKQQTIYGMLVAMLLLFAIGLVSVGSVADRVVAQDGEPTPTPELEDALERAQTFGGDSNNDWEPFVWEFDGVEMVLVPVGCFEMGTTDFEGASPVHTVCFDEPFWIDRYEVTNGQFAAFDGDAANDSYFSGEERPREQITWDEANAFCESRGARLPTEAEWEYAARGPDALAYPWGDEWDRNLVIGFRFGDEGTAPVGSILNGVSWVGALDISGNVWEWVADWYANDYYGTLLSGVVNPSGPETGDYRVVRGGSWYSSFTDNFRAADRLRLLPQYGGFDLGLRCARSRGS